MKGILKIILIIPGLISWFALSAQDFSEAAKAKVKVLEYLVGEWEGEGWVITPQGLKETSQVEESISFELDETVIKLRGVGMADKEGNQVKVHDALGVLYYDIFRQAYKMDSWIARGMHTSANVEIMEEGKLKWWFEAGPSTTIRYTITIEDGAWNEVGEMSQDGTNWRHFFEMNLTRK